MLFEVYVTRDRDETRSNHSYHSTMRTAFAVNTMVETGDKVST